MNFAPFHTTDCSMADVKCIYVVGTLSDTSWGLGKISATCPRETVVARLEMRVFIFTALVSISHKPSRAARGKHSKSCSATSIPHCFSPSASAPRSTTGKAVFAFTHWLWALCSDANLLLCLYSTCNRLVYVLPNSPPLSDNRFGIFKGKHFFF